MTTQTGAELTPAQRARAKIEAIEKRYKSPRNRIEQVNREGIFWGDIWRAMGLADDPEIKEAMQVYSEYVNSAFTLAQNSLTTSDGFTLFYTTHKSYGNWYNEIWIRKDGKEQKIRGGNTPWKTKKAVSEAGEHSLHTWLRWHEEDLKTREEVQNNA